MQGKVFIEDLALKCHIGVTAEEKKDQQEIMVSVFLDVDPEKAVSSDIIKDTADYSAIHSQILKLVNTSQFNLLETLASEIVDICLRDTHVNNVKVVAKKPQRYEDVKAVGVVIEKNKA